MTAQKFDWSTVGGRPQEAKAQAKQPQSFDWKSVGGRPHEEESNTNPLSVEADYLKGLGKGTLNKLGQFAASVANTPSSIYEHYKGKPLYHVNNPYEPEAPSSPYEASGQRMGIGPAEAIALLPMMKAANLVSKAPEGASMIARLLQSGKKVGAVGGASALQGLAIGEPERFEKAKEFGKAGAFTEGIGQLLSKGLSYTPSGKYKAAKQSYEGALSNEAQQEEQLKTAQAKAQEEIGLNTPQRMEARIETRNNQISEAISKLNELPAEHFPSMVTHEAHMQLPKIAEENLTGVNKYISERMGAGKNPDKPLAQNVADYFEGPKVPDTKKREGGLRGEIGNIFNEARDSLQDKKIQIDTMPSDAELEQMAEATLKKVVGGENFSKTQIANVKSSLKNDIKKNGGKSINAQTYFDTYRELEDSQNKIIAKLSKAKRGETQFTDKEIREMKFKAADIQGKLGDMEEKLKNQAGEEFFKKFELAKNRWANEYAPLRRNPIYRDMVDKGTVDNKDLMKSIRGEDPSSMILRKYFQTNPKAAELLTNYQFADNPMGLQKLTPYEQEFVNPKLTPHITKLINEQSAALQNVDQAKQQAEHFENLHKVIKEEQKLHNEALGNRAKIEKQIPVWKDEIKRLEEHAKIIRKELQNKKLTTSEVKSKKEELADTKRKKERFNRYISGFAKYGAFEEFIRHRLNKRD